HMAIVSFEDGSYVELISAREGADRPAPIWSAHIEGDGGPCAWAAVADDVASEAAHAMALGVPVRGPVAMNRRLVDGRLAEWELAYIGDGEPGALLPFMIEDKTP